MNKVLLLCLISLALSATLDLENARAQMLTRHNYYRAQHQADNLVRLSDLETIAQSWSDHLASINSMTHSSNKYNGASLGENLYWGPLRSNIGESAVDMWYEEISDYDFNNPGWKSGIGHFTQVVWKNSKKLGCGVGCGTSSYCYVTCNYYPAGNNLNTFATNVLPKTEGGVSDTVAEEEDTTAPEDNSSQSAADNPELEAFRNEILARHNTHRREHQVGDLERDPALEKIAQDGAEYMIEINGWYFSTEKYNGKSIGQNLFYAWGTPSGNSICDMWYNKVSSYDFSNPATSSFTQVVWKNTQKIGCGYACSGTNCYGSCVYYPPGNYKSQLSENVFPKTS